MHVIKYMVFKENATDKEICKARAEIVNMNVGHGNMYDSYGGYTLHNVICDDYNDALETIQAYDEGWYDDHGVKFRDFSGVKPTKALIDVERQIDAVRAKKTAYIDAHRASNVKAELIGCKACGSKIARSYLKSDYCPVCHKDLRPKTTLDRIKAYESRINELEKKRKELQKKQKDKAKIKWLIKLEYHV